MEAQAPSSEVGSCLQTFQCSCANVELNPIKNSVQHTEGFSEPLLKYQEHPHWAGSYDSPLVENLHLSRLADEGQMGYLKASQVALDADTYAVESICHYLCLGSAKHASALISLTCSEDQYLAKTLEMENMKKEKDRRLNFPCQDCSKESNIQLENHLRLNTV